MRIQQYSDSESLTSAIRSNGDPFVYKTISIKSRKEFENNGWILHKRNAKSLRMKKQKELADFLAHRIWNLFAKYNPEFINKGERAEIFNPKKNEFITFADCDYIEEEVRILSFVFCDSSSRRDLEEFVERLPKIKPDLSKYLNWGSDKHRRIGLIVWTHEVDLPTTCKKLLEAYGVLQFNVDDLTYFESLQKQIGAVSKYQFFARVFAGQEIPEIDNRVPAIKGIMGNHTYYSFSIEPETLLKICYVLHRVTTSEDTIAAYQRMIKRSRIKEIQGFLKAGGFFPNSIIINIDTKKKRPLKWEEASPKGYSSRASLGILHLPKNFRSAFVIDGQHRLYGYGETRFRFTNTIPVVAFENLPAEVQSRLFVEINHKQKSVPRNILLALDAELKWNSPDAASALAALTSKLIESLNTKIDSPLQGRIILAEEQGSSVRCITRAFITGYGFNRAKLFAEISKGIILKTKYLFAGDLAEKTLAKSYSFLRLVFEQVAESLPDQWAAGKDKGGFIAKNIGVSGIIQILSDILGYCKEVENYDYQLLSPQEMFEVVQPYLLSITSFLKRLSEDQLEALGRNWGSSGPTKIRLEFQWIINQKIEEFSPPGLEEYKKERSGQFNDETIGLVRDLQLRIREHVFTTLREVYADEEDELQWWRDLVPSAIQLKCSQRRIEEKSNEPDYNYIDLIDYKEIIAKNEELLLATFTRPGDEGIKKSNRLNWLVKINDVRKKTAHIERGNIKPEEYSLVKETAEWLFQRLVIN